MRLQIHFKDRSAFQRKQVRFGHYFQNNSENRNKKTGYIDFLGHTLFKYGEMRLNSVSTVKARFFCYCCFVFLFLFICLFFFCFHILSFFHWLFSISSYFWLLASSQRGSVIHIFLIQYINIIRESRCFSFTLTFIFSFCLLIY